MMFLRSLFFAMLVAIAQAALLNERGYYEGRFYAWLQEYGVEVESGDHFVSMLENFAANDDKIASHNKRTDVTYKLGHNQFSHMSFSEWRQYMRFGLQKRDPSVKASALHEAPFDTSALPTEIDWVKEGAVTGVKNQGQCGSCWSFSTTGGLEGAYFRKTGKLDSFSEQNLVSCDNFLHGGKDSGCNGGLMDNAFDWIAKNGGICTEEAYPYTSGSGSSGRCQTSCTKVAGSAPKSHTDVEASDDAMMSALAQQPVSIAIEADQQDFQLYSSGVFTAACGTQLDHGVLAVGYGTLDGVDYYKVKNSWGDSWGANGYILMKRGVEQNGGQCGMLLSASYPVL